MSSAHEAYRGEKRWENVEDDKHCRIKEQLQQNARPNKVNLKANYYLKKKKLSNWLCCHSPLIFDCISLSLQTERGQMSRKCRKTFHRLGLQSLLAMVTCSFRRDSLLLITTLLMLNMAS